MKARRDKLSKLEYKIQRELANTLGVSSLPKRLLRSRRDNLNSRNFPSEIRFQRLLSRHCIGEKYYRNHPLLNRYFIDFYFPRMMLCVELDGIHHKEPGQLDYDKTRDGRLVASGYKVLRLSNADSDSSWIKRFKEVCSGLSGVALPVRPKKKKKYFKRIAKKEVRALIKEQIKDFNNVTMVPSCRPEIPRQQVSCMPKIKTKTKVILRKANAQS
jgi:very-short-patch-repair endonuclease